MDVKLESLIEKIKKEGVEEAQRTSDDIINKAKKKAAEIVEQAKSDAEKIISQGKVEAAKFKANAEADIKQAARNTELLLKEKINQLFDRVFKRQVGAQLDPEFVKSLITKLVESWGKDSAAEVTVSAEDKTKLEALLFEGLSDEMKAGINLRISQELTKGFRISKKGDEVYYDFSDDAIAEVLKSLLNPNLKEILDS